MPSSTTDRSFPTGRVGGVEVDVFPSMSALVDVVLPWDAAPSPRFAVAINPLKVMTFRADRRARSAIESADIRYADGIGVVKALRRKGFDAVRIPGCELWERVMQRSRDSGRSAFLLGGKPGVADSVAARLAAQFPGIRICGTHHGYFGDNGTAEVLRSIAAADPDVVTVGMGSPAQENFVDAARRVHPRAFYMGVGGTYDVYLGRVRRAPPAFRAVGLEWFYRLAAEPSRWRRQVALLAFARDLLLNRL